MILNYPYAYDLDSKAEVLFHEKLYKAGVDESNGLKAKQQECLFPNVKGYQFKEAKDFSTALSDMCEISGELEKKRRELAIRADFNMCDTYKMFSRLDF